MSEHNAQLVARDQRSAMSEAQKAEQFLSILEADLCDIETLPEYATFPAGTYVFTATKPKVDTEKRTISLNFRFEQAVAVANEAEAGDVPADGSLYSERYAFDYDGIERLKKVFAPVFEGNQWTKPIHLVEGIDGSVLVLTLNKRKDKKDATKIYNGIVEAVLLPADMQAGA